jgi:pimeloyl-ACP methyl ester carboxylesterase
MAHGLGAVRTLGLPRYAERFAGAGLACLVFDYRHFGDSEGEPRQLIDIERQLDDWASAIAFARQVEGLDGARLALWGTSFGGGHAITMAARDRHVRAVVAQCPFTDGQASSRVLSVWTRLALAGYALRDAAAAWAGGAAVTVPVAGVPGETALLNAADVDQGWRALIAPGDDEPVNAAAARIVWRLPYYRPGKALREIDCPVLLHVCDYDSVAPASATLRHAARGGSSVEARRYPAGHFEIYVGDWFEQIVVEQTEFLTAHLSKSGTAPLVEALR